MVGVFTIHVPFWATLVIFIAGLEACSVFCETETENETEPPTRAQVNNDTMNLMEVVEDEQDEKSDGPAWTKEISKVEFSIFKTRDPDAPFEVDLQIFGEQHHLKLRRPESSVFAPGFKIEGREMKSDELEKVERDIFVDNESKSVIQVFETSNATYCLRGWIDGVGIVARGNCEMEAIEIRKRPRRGRHWCGVGRRRNNKKPKPRPKPRPQKPAGSQNQRPQSPQKPSRPKPKSEAQTQKPSSEPAHAPAPLLRQNSNTVGLIEAQLLFDDEGTRDIVKNGFTIIQYAAIMTKAMNVVYSSLSNPQLQLQLNGARNLTVDEDQMLVKSVKSDIFKVLKNLKAFVNQDKPDPKIKPHDIVVLFSGRDTLDDEGQSGTAGLAIIGTTCTPSGNAVCRDTGAAFEGVITGAHEIGHLMGCQHDFELTNPRPECYPGRNDAKAYVMGYQQKTPNVYKFSPCSQDAIRAYVKGNGSCVFTQASSKPISLDKVKFPGNVTTLDEQCAALLNPQLAGMDMVNPYPDDYVEDCLNITCSYIVSATGQYLQNYFKPSQGTRCVNQIISGVCKNQLCAQVSSGAGGQTAKDINTQCKDQVTSDFPNGPYTAVAQDPPKFLPCATKSYNCMIKDNNSGSTYRYAYTPQDGSPCVFKNVYGMCNAGTCQCKPSPCYQ